MIYHGDCLEVLKTIPDNSVDSCVTDPPYGLSREPDIREVLTKWMNGEDYTHRGGGFMGKTWDSFVPGPSVWREVYRVLKPGAHLLCFAGTRTQDLMTISLRLAGFEIRDVIEWLYFSGFPKSMDVGKQFDKRKGGASFVAKKWDGWGTALKPAHEPIIMARKPLDGTVADNVERWGTGALNIDGCRIRFDNFKAVTGKGGGILRYHGFSSLEELRKAAERGEKCPDGRDAMKTYLRAIDAERVKPVEKEGRFPANCATTEPDAFYSKYFNVTPPELCKKASKRDRNSDWRGEPIDLEPKNHMRVNAPRKSEEEKYATKHANNHPTVKPTELMAWLVRLVTPPGGVVLDPFAGSGSTLVAAKREGFDFIGIEREKEYVEIAKARTGSEVVEVKSEKSA